MPITLRGARCSRASRRFTIASKLKASASTALSSEKTFFICPQMWTMKRMSGNAQRTPRIKSLRYRTANSRKYRAPRISPVPLGSEIARTSAPAAA